MSHYIIIGNRHFFSQIKGFFIIGNDKRMMVRVHPNNCAYITNFRGVITNQIFEVSLLYTIYCKETIYLREECSVSDAYVM